MADDQLTLEQFGQKIKAKYPQYASMSDADVANKVIAKYPQYKSSIKAVPEAASTPPAQDEDWRDKFTRMTPHTDGDVRELMTDPTAVAREVGISLRNIGSGAASVLLHPVDTAVGMGKLFGAGMTGGAFNPGVMVEQFGPLIESLKEHPLETVEQGVGQAAVFDGFGEAVGPVTRGLMGKVDAARGGLGVKYGPRSVEIAGQAVPVTVGEAEPESAAGRTQNQLKRSGAGGPQFEKVEKAQQEATKNVIKNTAQQASGFIGPMQEEAGAVVDDAATASFRKAEPLYSELDTSLKSVPGTLRGVSKIVQDAISRARKLGIPIADEGGDISKIVPDKNGAIQWGGTKISKETHPERWAKLVEDGIIDDSGQSTPFRAYRMVRSQLLKMQRSATDDATRFAIGNEVASMDKNIDAALKGTGLEDHWTEANRLWREGKARIKVAQAITDATKGTPESSQAPGLAKVPTKLHGASLVDKLNTLADDGTLEAAFKPEEIANLRQSADILDRIQRTPVGKGSGESMSFARGLTHAVRGFKGPVIGAGIGATIEGLSGGSILHGAEMGAGIGFIVQSIGERALVNVMTKLDGVKALQAVGDAKTPAELDTAMHNLRIAAGVSAAVGPHTKRLRELAGTAQ